MLTFSVRLLLLLSVALTCCLALGAVSNRNTCTFLPDDARWPAPSAWSQLNSTVGGRLIATVPQGSVCHSQPYSNYDAAACATLQSSWGAAQTFVTKPAELPNYYFQNQSCDPFTPKARPCELGNYAAYSINVTSAEHVKAGLRFARDKNVRLVIKTTGHDYLGKSSGRGSLSLWLFNLKTIDMIPHYHSAAYSGPAIKLGPGVIAGEALQAAAQAGYRIVGGECASVGLGGGYAQGGGHSMLTSAYGLAADQVLEWEVTTARGEHLVATPERNADLYWALSGGGGGTYGVVLSMTARLYPDGPVGGGSLGFSLADAHNNQHVFWGAVEEWHRQLPRMVGDRNNIMYNMFNESFGVFAFTLPDQDATALEELLAPFTAHLRSKGITYTLAASQSASYSEHYDRYLGPLPWGSQPLTQQSSRLLPRRLVQDARANARFIGAVESIVASGAFLVGCVAGNAVNRASPEMENAVLPAWRDSIALCGINALWDFTAPLTTNLALKDELVSVHVPAIEAATPGSGVYLSEVDPLYRGDWKQTMYGSNYERLLRIKHAHDPHHLLYGHFAVGSDELSIDSHGRLCRL
ncbi:putative FAD-dependent isoamyl alcohol oxidase [Stachybotrys elegans]|uniref:FAD-dependent isoamyl alcohol oxidase n=1 Tax=Stachybotrys elegans TaxID=80388 RepID=A0A8K0SRG1_9HYPO|nr:putative FAD-dependent isoamyl alcohol oxidase [Stachybotrys elegans]